MINLKNKLEKRFDYKLFFTTLALCLFGLLMLYSATLSLDNGIKIVKTQLISTILGFGIIFVLMFFDYQILGDFYLPIYIASNILLVLVLFFGIGAESWGARSWLKLGPVTFQPSEFVKIGLIISLAKFIDMNKESLNEPFTLLKILGFAFLPVLLILLQPDAGTAMVFVFFIAAMLFAAGLDWKYIGYAALAGVLSLPVLWFRLDKYQKDRIFNFLDPARDASNTGYQAMQGRIAIGSGKFWGRGLFKGVQTQYDYIPQKQDDFIFSVIGEELGFVGGFFLIVLYFLFLKRLIEIARESTDLFGSLMVIGFAAILVFHIFENIGMTIGVMPITGIPLPFISHGGTFQLVNLVSVGIALSVAVHRENLRF